MKGKIDWLIELCENGICPECGKHEKNFHEYVCNAHTHGMEKYGHPDFQLVLRFSNEEIMWILNTLGLLVQSGRVFKAGDLVSEIYEDCCVRLDTFEETGRTVLRAIIPDNNGRWPEDSECMENYRLQLLKTDEIIIGGFRR